jgi:tetratricopeptide (TPR) repeat protein
MPPCLITTPPFCRPQVIATGNYDYGIRLLLSCCKLDPANLIYRQALRRTEKTKYRNNLRGSWFAWLTTSPLLARLKAAQSQRDHLKVIELAEDILVRNPWHTAAQIDQAAAADVLGLLDLAIWTLEQARQKNPRDLAVNRPLARLYEKRGNFTQAIALWELIRKAAPKDLEAQHKAKDLAASETIARGHYVESVKGAARAAEDPAAEDASPVRPAGASSGTVRRPGLKDVPAPAERGAGEAAKLRAKIEADPSNPNAHLQLAAFHRRLGQLDKAREVLEQAIVTAGEHFELTAELADLEIEPFRRNLAVAEDKLRNNPDDEELRRVRMRLLREINVRELDLYRRKADRFPHEMGHKVELGIRLLRAGQTDEAIRELQAARNDPRYQWRTLLFLGHCFKGRNNWRLAKRNFEEALQHLPAGEEATRKELLFHLATGNAEAGDLAAAMDFGHELANIDFLYRDIGRLLDEWQEQLERSKAGGED